MLWLALSSVCSRGFRTLKAGRKRRTTHTVMSLSIVDVMTASFICSRICFSCWIAHIAPLITRGFACCIFQWCKSKYIFSSRQIYFQCTTCLKFSHFADCCLNESWVIQQCIIFLLSCSLNFLESFFCLGLFFLYTSSWLSYLKTHIECFCFTPHFLIITLLRIAGVITFSPPAPVRNIISFWMRVGVVFVCFPVSESK